MTQIAKNKTKWYLKVKTKKIQVIVFKLSYIKMLKCKGHCEEWYMWDKKKDA